MKLLFIRHATMIIKTNDKCVLVDPVFSGIGEISPIPNKKNKSKNPLIKLNTTMEELLNVDAVIITHMHMDHFDMVARETLSKTIQIFCQPCDEKDIKELGFENVKAIESELEWNGITMYRVDGKHGEGEVLKMMGKTSGFILENEKKYRLYIVGDSIWCDDVEKSVMKFTPNAIVINAGAATLPMGRAITMDQYDIESLINKAPKSKVIAVHMDAWNHCMLRREDLKTFLKTKGFEEKVIIPVENELVNLD